MDPATSLSFALLDTGITCVFFFAQHVEHCTYASSLDRCVTDETF